MTGDEEVMMTATVMKEDTKSKSVWSGSLLSSSRRWSADIGWTKLTDETEAGDAVIATATGTSGQRSELVACKRMCEASAGGVVGRDGGPRVVEARLLLGCCADQAWKPGGRSVTARDDSQVWARSGVACRIDERRG